MSQMTKLRDRRSGQSVGKGEYVFLFYFFKISCMLELS